MGHKITKEGLKTDPQKTEPIKDFPVPQSLEELRRFLGMLNYLSRYLSHLAEAIHSLQNLFKKDVPWTWTDSQEHAFQTVIFLYIFFLSPTAPYLPSTTRPKKELTIVNDASVLT